MKSFAALTFGLLAAVLLSGQTTGQLPLSILSESPSEMTLQWRMPDDFHLKKVSTPQGEAVLPQFAGGKPLLRKGMPDVPKYAMAVRLLPDSEWAIASVSGEYEDIAGVEVAPSKGNLLRNQLPAAIPFEYGDAYAEDAFFPGVLAELQQPFVLREARGQGLWLYPVQYHPTRRLLRVYRSLTLRLTRRDAQNLNGQ
ncbi:MAG: hypothetical protein NZM41_13345, partial [Saprospiraceae bacterium]|nr:hypothetical protein [Saprospiraceae bacterium]